VLDKNTEQLEMLKNELPQIEIYTCDVSNRESVTSVFANIHASTSIDILINNAGIYYEAPTVEHTEGMIQKMFAVNAEGPILCSKAVIPYMREKKQ
jgi:NAD(P)-dependent dehydrogenase (short-subunit alcohol dehydrogenase family)